LSLDRQTLAGALTETRLLFQEFQTSIFELPFVCVGIRSFCRDPAGEGEEIIVRAQIDSWPLVKKTLSARWLRNGAIGTNLVGWVGVAFDTPFSCMLSMDSLVRWAGKEAMDPNVTLTLERHSHRYEENANLVLSKRVRGMCDVEVSVVHFKLRNVGSQKTLLIRNRLMGTGSNFQWRTMADNGLQFRLLEQETKLYLDLKILCHTAGFPLYLEPLWTFVCEYVVLGHFQ